MSTVSKNDHPGDEAGHGNLGHSVSHQAGASLDQLGGHNIHPRRGTWHVDVLPRGQTVTRKAYYRGRRGTVTAEPEEVIWPTWPATTAEEVAVHGAPLEDLQRYWGTAGNRLRESAKWMATVLGAAIATVIGASPLAGLSNHLQLTAVLMGGAGLILLGLTMLLVLRVMQPQAVSYADVQAARPPHGLVRVLHKGLRRHWRHSYVLESPLYRWRHAVESHQDLYLPCAVTSLRGLRRSMVLEEATLVALALARESAQDAAAENLSLAQTARTARLLELRVAAARIATIGEYYALRTRSTQATYGGIVCGVLGTAAIVLAFAWPIK
jgi:hypothetical protein